MKLYTEEQVRDAYNEGCWNGFNDVRDKENDTINSLTPIEIPSDEDEEKAAISLTKNIQQHIGFIEGAKWMREQILNQNK